MQSCTHSLPFPCQSQVMLSDYSTFAIGGPAKFFTTVYEADQMVQIIQYAHKTSLNWLVIGKGSNILFDDQGFEGLVILNKIEGIRQSNGQFEVGSGFSFPRLGTLSAKQGYHGLEFAAGIPATVGGAIYMNAGAQGQETFDRLIAVDYLAPNGIRHTLKKQDLFSGYRKSCFQDWGGVVLGAQFSLEPQPEVYAQQKQILDYRLKTQPYGQKSIGCIFRNPEGQSAGKIIEELGLKGLRVGGVQVSTKHANFIVNENSGTSRDVCALITEIKKCVFEKTGILLHEEIQYINKNDTI